MAHSDEKKVALEQKDMKTDLYVTNIPAIWTESDLMHYFLKYQPLRASILMNQNSGFVNFHNHQDALNSITEFHNKRPFPTAYPLFVKFANNSSIQNLQKGVNHNKFWKNSFHKNGRIKKERDLNKLQQLILQYPHSPQLHYEYSCGLASLLDVESKVINNPNLVQLWLKHIDIAINLSKKQNLLKYNNNRPTLAWVKRKIQFCIHIYHTNHNCYNIDIEDLLNMTWNAVLNYNRYYFYLSYLRLLHVTQREELVTESLKLYKEIWNGNLRKKYFQKYGDYVYFVICMIRNGCALNEIIAVVVECWKMYYYQFGNNSNPISFNSQTPNQKSATFDMYKIVIIFVKHICNEYEWNIEKQILLQSIDWLKIIIKLRPHYVSTYILLSYFYFFVDHNYICARNVLQNAVRHTCDADVYNQMKITMKDRINGNINGITKNEKKWKMFSEWVKQKVLNLNDIDNINNATPILGNGGMLQPGSKFNINMI